MNIFEMFGLLVFCHALADYPLQGDFLAKAKNHTAPIPGVPWYQALLAHSAIHAGLVGLVTGSLFLAVAELVVHAWTDHAKCKGKIDFDEDQFTHILCKIVWVFIALKMGWVSL